LPHIGDVQLTELTDERILAMYRDLETKVSPSMRKRVHVTLRTCLNYALECKDIKSSPLATIRQNAPRHKSKPVIPLEEAEISLLLQAAKGNRLEALITLALDTGMRQGELFALRWSDIDLSKGKVYVQRAASETPDGVVVDYCKTEKSRRELDITRVAANALRQRKALAMREGLGDCALVFPSEQGCVMRKSNFARRIWEPMRKAAKLPGLKFHTLRHTAAVLLLKANVHPKIVSERLGHASVSITLDVYSAWIPGLQAQAAEAMAGILGRLRQKHLKAA
jgi:integrase